MEVYLTLIYRLVETDLHKPCFERIEVHSVWLHQRHFAKEGASAEAWQRTECIGRARGKLLSPHSRR